jgi:hypothetical protein
LLATLFLGSALIAATAGCQPVADGDPIASTVAEPGTDSATDPTASTGSAPHETRPTGPTGSTIPPKQSGEDEPDAAPESRLFNYERSGGVAGFSDHITIDRDGHGIYTDRSHRHEFNLTAAAMGRLVAELGDAKRAAAPVREDHPDAMLTSYRYGAVYVQPTEYLRDLTARLIAAGKQPKNQK